MIFQLNKEIAFPDPHLAEDDGMLAVGGDLSIERLKLAYSMGIFPWYSYRFDVPRWWCPKERFVLFPNEVHISHSMRSLINSGKYSVTYNKDFSAVINSCSKVDGRNRDACAWLGPEIIKAYTKLHELGLASSVEVWCDGYLVGGFYGVTLGRCFFGESMFSHKPNASKFALVALAQKMQCEGGLLIDCQIESEHLKSMGARLIPYDEYIEYVNQ